MGDDDGVCRGGGLTSFALLFYPAGRNLNISRQIRLLHIFSKEKSGTAIRIRSMFLFTRNDPHLRPSKDRSP